MGQLKNLKNLKSQLKQPAGQLKNWKKSQKPTEKTWNNPKSQLKDLRKIQKAKWNTLDDQRVNIFKKSVKKQMCKKNQSVTGFFYTQNLFLKKSLAFSNYFNSVLFARYIVCLYVQEVFYSELYFGVFLQIFVILHFFS